MSDAAVARPSYRFFAPEVIQSSTMDCGPASLKCLLGGFGIDVSYGRLREACQTDVDGTSIDVMEDVAIQLGLEAEQVLVPKSHLALDEAGILPAIVVVRPSHGPVHFVVAWRRIGNLLQVMDPAAGRRWMSVDAFLRDVHVHDVTLPADAWRDWAGSASLLGPLARALRALGLGRRSARRLLDSACSDSSWVALAALDAATRMMAALLDAGGLSPSQRLAGPLEQLAKEASAHPPVAGTTGGVVPESFWTARLDPKAPEMLRVRGAVVVSARGRASTVPEPTEAKTTIAPELLAAMREPARSVVRDVVSLVGADGWSDAVVVVIAAVLGAAAVLVQGILLRGLLDVGHSLGIAPQRLGAMGALTLFLVALLLVQIPSAAALQRVGRKLEARLRLALFAKVPRIGDRYFAGRLTSDMAERSHAIPAVRRLPQIVAAIVGTGLQLLFTVLGLVWLEPRSVTLALITVAVGVALSVGSHAVLRERDMRARAHGGALTRFLLDALLGLTPIRAHGAEQAMLREQEGLLAQHTSAQLDLQRGAVVVEGAQAVVGVLLAAAMLLMHADRTGSAGTTLLFAYWALALPSLTQSLVASVRQLPAQRNVLLRLFEPLGAPEEDPGAVEPGAEQPTFGELDLEDTHVLSRATPRVRGVRISMRDVEIHAGGHVLLERLDLDIARSSHVAIVGPSGSGKTTLVGLLLGWHRPAAGSVWVDGEPLTGRRLARLRSETAWVDPSVWIYNQRLVDNLAFGSEAASPGELAWALEQAELRDVVERMPDGMQTSLGEGGALLSGGEAQRVRLARAMLRPDARLVILDEPFRGLDRDRRRQLLRSARDQWANATLVCVTHDVGETLSFPRVLVVEGGKIVEDGDPNYLAAAPGSRYAAMLEAERAVRRDLWAQGGWSHVRLERGRIAPPVDEPARPAAAGVALRRA